MITTTDSSCDLVTDLQLNNFVAKVVFLRSGSGKAPMVFFCRKSVLIIVYL